MVRARVSLVLAALFLGGCAVIDVVTTTASPPAIVIPWTEAARRCYQDDRDRQNPVYRAATTRRYQGLAFPGSGWLIGKAACDAFVDEMLAAQRLSGAAVTPAVAAEAGRSTTAPPAAPAPGSAVTPPPAVARPAPAEFTPAPELRPIYFDFDRAAIRPDARTTLDAMADWLRANAREDVLVEGHCDERGTNEYNLALGERRARAARDYLVSHGVSAERITTISYGEERPVCTTSDEACWQLNRRAEFRRRGR